MSLGTFEGFSLGVGRSPERARHANGRCAAAIVVRTLLCFPPEPAGDNLPFTGAASSHQRTFRPERVDLGLRRSGLDPRCGRLRRGGTGPPQK